jgi:hypothetical protein
MLNRETPVLKAYLYWQLKAIEEYKPEKDDLREKYYQERN